MSLRRLLFFVALFTVLTISVYSRFDARAQTSGPSLETRAEKAEGGLELLVSPDPAYVIRGSSTRFTFVVLNSSPMQDVIVFDSLLPPEECTHAVGNLEKIYQNYSDFWPDERLGDSCRYENILVPFTSDVTVSGTNTETDQRDSATTTARVEVLELTATITPDTDIIAAPGGPVRFAVAVTNLSSVDVPLTMLDSPQFGDLSDLQNDAVRDSSCATEAGLPLLAKNGGSFACAFTFDVGGPAGDQTFIVDALGEVGIGTTVDASGSTVVKIYEIIATSLAPENERVLAGSSVNLTATIQNLDISDSVKILTMEDTAAGDVTLLGDCTLPQLLSPGDTYSCGYEQIVTAKPGEEQTYILNVAAETDTVPSVGLKDQALAAVTVFDPIVHLPFVAVIPRPTSCSAPLFISTDAVHLFYPDTTHAIYWFVLSEKRDVTVELDNFKPPEGQVTIYKDMGNGCDPATLQTIGYDGSSAEKRDIPLVVQQPGNYYVYVYSGANLSTEQPYSLTIRTQ